MIGLNKGFLRYVVKKKCQTPASDYDCKKAGREKHERAAEKGKLNMARGKTFHPDT